MRIKTYTGSWAKVADPETFAATATASGRHRAEGQLIGEDDCEKAKKIQELTKKFEQRATDLARAERVRVMEDRTRAHLQGTSGDRTTALAARSGRPATTERCNGAACYANSRRLALGCWR